METRLTEGEPLGTHFPATRAGAALSSKAFGPPPHLGSANVSRWAGLRKGAEALCIRRGRWICSWSKCILLTQQCAARNSRREVHPDCCDCGASSLLSPTRSERVRRAAQSRTENLKWTHGLASPADTPPKPTPKCTIPRHRHRASALCSRDQHRCCRNGTATRFTGTS